MSDASFSEAPGRAPIVRSAVLGRWLVVLATVFWGTTATLARFVFRDRHVPALTVVELRLSIASLLLFAWLAVRDRAALRIVRADWGYVLTLSLFGVAAVQGSYYFAISRLGVGLAILLQYLAPSLIVGWQMLRGERPRPTMILAVLLAVAGTALLVRGVDAHAWHAGPLAWTVGFTSAFIFAFYILYSRRGLAHYAPETMLAYTFGIAAAFWAIVTPPWKIAAAQYPGDLWAMFLVLGIFSTLVPFLLFYSGLRRLPPAEAGVIATSEPIVALAAAAIFLHEGLHAVQWLGAASIVAAAWLASRASSAPVAAAG